MEIIVVVIGYIIYKLIFNARVDNYPTSRLDNTKIGMDSAKGMSKHQIQQNMLKGKYDK